MLTQYPFNVRNLSLQRRSITFLRWGLMIFYGWIINETKFEAFHVESSLEDWHWTSGARPCVLLLTVLNTKSIINLSACLHDLFQVFIWSCALRVLVFSIDTTSRYLIELHRRRPTSNLVSRFHLVLKSLREQGVDFKNHTLVLFSFGRLLFQDNLL